MKSFSRSNQCQRLFLRSQRSDIEEISKLAHGYSVDVAQNHETSYRETAAAILVNWDCPVWKCGNLVSTGDVLSIPEPTHRPCGPLFRVSRSNQVLSSHSNVPQCRDHTPLFPLESNGSPSCTRGMYLPPSLLLIPLSLFLPPLYLSRCADTVTNFWRKRPGAIRLRGLSTSKEPLHLCRTVFTFAKRTIEFLHCKIFTVSMELVDEGRTPVPSWLCDVTKIHVTFPPN